MSHQHVQRPNTHDATITWAPTSVPKVQRRIVSVLVASQVVGGIGVAIGISFGALLAASVGGTMVSGLAQSMLVIGAALLALPVTRVMRSGGRRPGLALAYTVGALGATAVVAAAAWGSLWLLLAGLFLFGGGSAANYQARYAAVDLAEPHRRGRQLSLVVWATTIGSVAGPNLAPLADAALHRLGTATYAGPFVFSALAFVVAGVGLALLLRPDPLLVSRAIAPRESTPPARGLRPALREVSASPSARLGMAAVAVGHAVMVAVMAMTPVHIGESGHATRTIGFVVSAHIAGMYGLSPVTGWLTDRLGRRPVILTGVALLLVACAVAATAGHDALRLSVGLFLLGTGWSATMVAGSTLLSESVGLANKAAVQGLSDVVMGVAAAGAGAVSGVIVAWSSYATLTMLAALATVPLVALALRPARPEGV